MTASVPPRSAIDPVHTWDKEILFASPQAFDDEVQAILDTLPLLTQAQGTLHITPRHLADWLEQYAALMTRAWHIAVYGTLVNAVDMGDQPASEINDRARALLSRVRSELAFLEPELLAIGLDTLLQWAEMEPRLTFYTHRFRELAQMTAHVRSAEVEGVLNALTDPFRSATATHGILTDVDMPIPPVEGEEGAVVIAQGNINSLLAAPDREVRRAAWEQYADAHLIYKNTIANVVITGVKQNVFMARARNYPSALEASVASNFIPLTVFERLIATFRQHLPLWHRYWRVRRSALGVETLHPWDVRAPLTAARPQIPYDQAVDWIGAGMEPLGEEYVAILRRGATTDRWVDIYPNQGKRAGAFSTGAQGTHPYILMSYHDDLLGLSTLAHELGHSMHSYYTRRTQAFVYSRYSTFVAEVASNFNQALVRDYLLRTQPDRDFQIAVLEEAMSNFHRYFFVMPILAQFEAELHARIERGEGLTATAMSNLLADLFVEGYGDEVAFDRDQVGITWAQFPTHMYLNFYVYMYATGISGAHALAEQVLNGTAGAAERYLTFLSAGSSQFPIEALQAAGVDLTTSAPVESAFGVMEHYIAQLEELLTDA